MLLASIVFVAALMVRQLYQFSWSESKNKITLIQTTSLSDAVGRNCYRHRSNGSLVMRLIFMTGVKKRNYINTKH